MTNYPDEIYDCPDGTYAGKREWVRYGPNTHAGVMAQRAYNLGREHAKQEATAEPDWHNLTEQIQAGANIDWEQLDGVKARCVHAEIGTLTHKLTRRDRNFPPESILEWDFVYPLLSTFHDSWEGHNGWTLWIDRPVPLKRKTADQLEPGTCFTDTENLDSWIVYVDISGDKWAQGIGRWGVLASELEVFREYGIGTFKVADNEA